MSSGIEIRRGADRFVTEAEGRTTLHSFSFGRHFDPDNLGFAAMQALNDEHLPPGTGYPDHPHADTEIITWVVEGALRHTSADGTTGLLLPGDVQRISAGDGIVHAETTEPGVRTRFLQTWLRPDSPGGPSSYARSHGLGELAEVVGASSMPVGVAGARLLLGTPVAGELALPGAARTHLFAVGGRYRVGDDEVGPGDAVRLTGAGAAVEVLEPGPLAVWAFAT